jgi:hypothetical protein
MNAHGTVLLITDVRIPMTKMTTTDLSAPKNSAGDDASTWVMRRFTLVLWKSATPTDLCKEIQPESARLTLRRRCHNEIRARAVDVSPHEVLDSPPTVIDVAEAPALFFGSTTNYSDGRTLQLHDLVKDHLLSDPPSAVFDLDESASSEPFSEV